MRITYLGSRPRRLADDPIPFHLGQDLVIDHIVKPGKVVVDVLEEKRIELFNLFDLDAIDVKGREVVVSVCGCDHGEREPKARDARRRT